MDMKQDIRTCEGFAGRTRMPADFKYFWEKQLDGVQTRLSLQDAELCFSTDAIQYTVLTFSDRDGGKSQAAFLRPMNAEPKAVVLDFHDTGRPARGFFYLSRYVAMGYSVLAPGRRAPDRSGQLVEGILRSPEEPAYATIYVDAVAAAWAARKLCGELPVYAYGEGVGAACAIAAAAFGGVKKCAALNPMPADFRTVAESGGTSGFYQPLRDYFRGCDPAHEREDEFFQSLDYIDSVNFAGLLKGKLLLGTSMLDEVSPAAAQFALFHRAGGEKQHSVFLKFGHERINFFENDALNFFLAE